MADLKIRLFLISFLILFLELSLIRFIPSHLRLIGYFSNLILLATFLGIGTGMMFTKKRFNLIHLFPFTLFVLLSVVIYSKIELNISSFEVIFFKDASLDSFTALEPEVVLPAVFLLTSLTFLPLGQYLGRLFTNFKPLYAYTIDILGSIAGIVVLTIFSYLSVGPLPWFLLSSIVFYLIIFKKEEIVSYINLLPLTAIILILFVQSGNQVVWSPYYKLEVVTPGTLQTSDPIYYIKANNNIHQYISRFDHRQAFYYAPYKIFDQLNYKNILIIGSGGGADIATALAFYPQVERIDAVEIDPKIQQLGQQLNPDKPYQDSRVHIFIDDGRSFLEKSDEKYDLIIYALTDSLVLTTKASNIRLESFLFTKESFQKAKEHLTTNGLFVIYNFFREQWLIDRLAKMSEQTFGKTPYVVLFGEKSKAAAILNGPKISEIKPTSIAKPHPTDTATIAEDDWPFIYLKNKSIPFFYLKFLAIILAISFLLIWLSQKEEKRFSLDFRFFFFGAAFLLLETKSLVNFSLLFGNTWLVNSLVIAAILMSVLIANLLSFKFTFKPLFLYSMLFTLLILNWIMPTTIFLKFEPTGRYILGSIFYFSPIFIANLLFSQLFKKTETSSLSFGSNLLGAVFGGLTEYSSLALGNKALIFFVALFYVLSLVKLNRR